MKLKLRIALLAALMAMAMAAFASSAQACSYTGASQVFSHWGDKRDYVLAPDGGFESGAKGWTLSGGAATVAGNESYYLNSTTDSTSLSLPGGSAAVSPAICMSIETPVFRMVARNTGDPTSQLRVTATYTLLGLLQTKTIATVTSGSAWAPTEPQSVLLTLSTALGTLTPSSIQVHLTPLDSKGQWQVDDLYVDPFARR